MKALLFSVLLLLCALPNSFAEDTESLSCELVMDLSDRQATLASGHLTKIKENYSKAKNAYEQDLQAQALRYLSTAETSLYQGRSYYVLALMKLDQASKACPDTFAQEISTLQVELTMELEELDGLEEAVHQLKELIFS